MSEYRFRFNDSLPLHILRTKRVEQAEICTDPGDFAQTNRTVTVIDESESVFTQGSYSLLVPNLGSFLKSDSPDDLEEVRSWLNLAPGEDLDSSEYHKLAAAFLEIAKKFQSLSGESTDTKSIGVNSHQCLYSAIKKCGYKQGVTCSNAARSLFIQGLEHLENDLEEKSSKSVFDALASSYNEFQNRPQESNKQWQLRVDKYTYGTALLLGKEYGHSLSQLARLVIADQLLKADSQCAAIS